MTSDDLDLVETSDLIDALHRRTNGGSVIVATDTRSGGDGKGGQGLGYRGGWASCLGIAVWAQDYLRSISGEVCDPEGT